MHFELCTNPEPPCVTIDPPLTCIHLLCDDLAVIPMAWLKSGGLGCTKRRCAWSFLPILRAGSVVSMDMQHDYLE